MTKIEGNKAIFTPSIRRTQITFLPSIKRTDTTFAPEIPRTQSTLSPEIVRTDPTIQVISPFENVWIIDLNGKYVMDLNLQRAVAWQITN